MKRNGGEREKSGRRIRGNRKGVEEECKKEGGPEERMGEKGETISGG